MQALESVVVFGGTGFIGTHLVQHFLRENLARKIVLVDLAPPREAHYANLLCEAIAKGTVEYRSMDVRRPIAEEELPQSVDLVVNLAAVHREPGHRPSEYYETNLKGAENVTAFASRVGCPRIAFTSSISPYGPSEEMKDESSLPVPETPYGGSKLAAEKIHLAWLAGSPGRKLLILRPGVVFGPGEGGNVTRLIRSIVRGYFVYVGNRNTRKAGGYIKELCHVFQFGIDCLERSGEPFLLLNFSMNPVPAMEEFVSAIRSVGGVRGIGPLNIPRWMLLGVSYPIAVLAGAFRINTPINPVRVRKLFRSTLVDPKALRELHYTWRYSLIEAFADWKEEMPDDFAA
jgi:nucleoside-diphosphate-sugar epimerase